MNIEYEAHRSDFPGFPEGPFVLMTGRLQSEPGVAFSGFVIAQLDRPSIF